jgi:hypothetical protein
MLQATGLLLATTLRKTVGCAGGTMVRHWTMDEASTSVESVFGTGTRGYG